MAGIPKHFRFSYSLTTLLVVVALCALAVWWWQHYLGFDTPVQFDETTIESQEAVFYLDPPFDKHWRISRPSRDDPTYREGIFVHGRPVLIERHQGYELVEEWGLPRSFPGTVLVRARIHLEKGRYPLPRGKVDPGVPPHDEYEDCYFARLDKVFAVIWRNWD